MNPEERLRALRDADRWSGDAAEPPRRRTTTDGIRVVLVSAAVLVAIVVVVVALARIPHASEPASPSPSPSATPTETSAPVRDGVIAWDPALVRSQRRYSERVSSDVAACTAKQLRVWAQPDGGGALGTYYQAVFLRNTGALCSLGDTAVRLSVGSVASVGLSADSGDGSSRLLPTGATERLEASHVEDCNGGGQPGRTLPMEPLRIEIDGVVRALDARMPFAEPCDLGFDTTTLTDPVQAYGREPGFTSVLTVSIPAISDAYRGGAFDYTVTLTNSTDHPVVLRPGRVFRQLVYNQHVASLTEATLAVGTGMILQPGRQLQLQMHVPAPGDVDPSYAIAWYLSDGTGGVAGQD